MFLLLKLREEEKILVIVRLSERPHVARLRGVWVERVGRQVFSSFRCMYGECGLGLSASISVSCLGSSVFFSV